MRTENWLVPGIWLALSLSLGILLYTNAKNTALLEGNNFSVRNKNFSVLTVVADDQRYITITLRKRFTAGEQALLRAVTGYFNMTVINAAAFNADTYQLRLPLASCEFSAGMLVYCDSNAIDKAAADQFYSVSWWQSKQPLFQLTSQQLPADKLKLSFHTSRERKSVLGTAGRMKSNCILQAHLEIAVQKSFEQTASMTVEDVFFTLSNRACVA